jgi:hypothetical protein
MLQKRIKEKYNYDDEKPGSQKDIAIPKNGLATLIILLAMDACLKGCRYMVMYFYLYVCIQMHLHVYLPTCTCIQKHM